MAIYTKFGDKGKTSLLSGTVVPKHHIRIETYGTIDELNTYIGMLRSQDAIYGDTKNTLIDIQDSLFVMGSYLAMDQDPDQASLPAFNEDIIGLLEREIDKMDKDLPPLRNFIHPGGNFIVSACHISRTVCRRAERRLVQMGDETSVNEQFIVFINRLSDYLFVLSRKLAKDTQAEEIPWKPNQK